MSNIASPAVARRRVRLALRSAREAKDLTQSQVADAMEWSLSKVMRIEKGEVNVAANDLRILLDFLDIKDPGRVQTLIDDARASRQERYTIDAADRSSLTPAMIELYQFEDAAVALRIYHNFVVPGRLQARDYAAAILHGFAQNPGQHVIGDRLETRMRRQQSLLVSGGPAYHVLLDESVLLRRIGTVQVMVGQLEFLRRIVGESNTELRILPLSDGTANKYFYGPFQLCDLDDTQSAFLYKEDGPVDHAVHAEDEISRHRRAFDDMWSSALGEHDSLERIASALEYHREQDG
jgi:transcriptional regulator with XRE-family HTH domain